MSEPFRHAIDHLRAADPACPHSLRAHAVEAVRAVAESDTALFYSCADAGPDQPVVRTVFAGQVPRLEDAFAENAWTISRLNRGERDLRHVPRAQRIRFHRFGDLPAAFRRRFERTEHHERVWSDAGVVDVLRLLSYDDDGSFAGWIGGVQSRGSARFGVRQRRRAQRIARAIRDALVTATRLEGASRPTAPGLLVVTPSGEVEMASTGARRWLEIPEFRRALAAVLARSRPSEDGAASDARIADARARVYRMEGAGGDRVAVHVEPLPRVALSPAAQLTAAQRRVADLAAIGLTVPEIAAELGSSAHTIKEHLKVAYRTLGVANRIELAELLQAGWGRH